MSFSERLYRLLLKAYPKNYRREYAEPMAQHFRDQLREVSGIDKLFRFWIRIMADLARTVPARYLEAHALRHGNFRFAEDARQAIFFARSEASSFSRSEITLEHLLLGLLRNDPELRSALGQKGVEDAVARIEASETAARRVPPSETLPMSRECKLAASHAIEKAVELGEPQVTNGLLIRAILQRESTLASRILRDYGFR